MVRGRADAALDAAAAALIHESALLALHVSYGSEIAKLKMQLLAYREALVAAGIEPPDKDGEDLLRMWESCKLVIKAAHGALAELGTSKELLVPMRP